MVSLTVASLKMKLLNDKFYENSTAKIAHVLQIINRPKQHLVSANRSRFGGATPCTRTMAQPLSA